MSQLEKLINGCYGTKTTKCYYLTLYAIYAMDFYGCLII